MTANTPGGRVETPRTSAAGAPQPTCLAWVHDDRRLCHLPAGHAGSHLALPVPWPRAEITRDNPSYRKAAS